MKVLFEETNNCYPGHVILRVFFPLPWAPGSTNEVHPHSFWIDIVMISSTGSFVAKDESSRQSDSTESRQVLGLLSRFGARTRYHIVGVGPLTLLCSFRIGRLRMYLR